MLSVFVMPADIVPYVESAQSILQAGERVMLTVAMGLFLAYLTFMLSAVTISAALTRISAVNVYLRGVRHIVATPRRFEELEPTAEPHVLTA